MTDVLETYVSAATGKRVLLVGDLILDRYVYGDAERISPEAPVPVLRATETSEAVGGSANVAACLAALGVRVMCCGVVGQDAHGDTLMSLLAEIGADGEGVLQLPNRPTTTKTRLVGLAQHKHRQQLLRLDREDATPLGATTIDELADLATILVSKASVVCLEDYNKGVITKALAERVIDAATKAGVPVLVDPARLSDYSRYAGASVITPNREELSLAVGRKLASIEDVGNAAREVMASANIGAVVATVDRDGSVVVEPDADPQHIPTIPRSVYDNTGAGDAVLAMLAAAVAAGADLPSAAKLANVAGGLEVERFGCVPITAGEVLAELRLETRSRTGKLHTLAEVVAELSVRRNRGETVAFTNGCFDILHAGHVAYLQEARRTASMLVVGLNSDESVRRQGKGDDRPINPFEDRAAVLGALECVDHVVGFDDDTPIKLIEQIKPDVLVKGADWEGKEVVGKDLVEKAGGRVLLVPLLAGRSSTDVIDRIREGATARA